MTVGRLTYTSVDALRGREGGWQVKQEEAVSATDHARALELVATNFGLVDSLSRFPSAAEVAGLPRRLQVGRSKHGSTLLVHSAPAGPDATGRPGNTFNHVVVMPLSPDDGMIPEGRRPVELWRSPDWLVPWGADAVRQAVLVPPAIPRPGALIDRRTVAELLSSCDDAGRAVIGALLDGVGAALAGGLPVVLLADDQDDAVLLIAAACMLAGPQVGGTLTFNTWERAFALRGRRGLPAVTLVPRVDLPGLAGLQAVVLDPGAQLPADGGVWTDALGRAVAVSAWSGLGTALCGLASGDVLDRLEALDEIAELNPRAAAAAALWPLAVAVAEWSLPGSERASEVLLRVGLALVDDEQTREEVHRLGQAALGATAFDAAEVLTRLSAEPDRNEAQLVEFMQVWVERALSEPDFLTGPWPPALPPVEELGARVGRCLVQSLSSMLERLLLDETSPPEQAVRLLRLLDLAEMLGVGTELPEAPLVRPVGLAAQALLGPAGPEVLQQTEPLTSATLARLVPDLNAWVERSSRPYGTRLVTHLRPLLLDRLGPRVPLPPALLTELAVLAAPDREDYASLRVEAVLGVLAGDLPPVDDERVRARTRGLLEHFSFGRAWDVGDLLRLQAAVGLRPDVDLQDAVGAALERARPGTTAASRLAAGLLDAARNGRPIDEGVRQLAQVHAGLAPGWHLGGPASTGGLVDVVAYGLSYLDDETRVPEETARHLGPYLLVAAVLALAWDERADRGVLALRSSRRLGQVAPRLPELALSVLDAIPLLREAMRHDASVLPAVFAAVARSVAEPGRQAGSGAKLWRASLDPAAVRVTGRLTLGEALLHEVLRSMPAVELWLHDQLDALVDLVPLGTMLGVREWAADLPRGGGAAHLPAVGGWTPDGSFTGA